MRHFNATDAKNKFGELLEAGSTAPVLITKGGAPVSYIVPAAQFAPALRQKALQGVKQKISAGDEEVAQALRRFSAGELARTAAQKVLGLGSYGDLIDALDFAGFPLPLVNATEREEMMKSFLPGRSVAEPTSKSISIVIPDAGVLISLAKADILELLMVFNPRARLTITDAVEYEATRSTERDDALRIRSFLSRYAGNITVDATSFHGVIERSRLDPTFSVPDDMGEMSIYSYVNAMKTRNPGEPTLVLFEDNWFLGNSILSSAPANVHLLSTMAFLEGLEKLVPEFSAKAAMDRIASQRPTFNRKRKR